MTEELVETAITSPPPAYKRIRLTRLDDGTPVLGDIEEARTLYEDVVQNIQDIDVQLSDRKYLASTYAETDSRIDDYFDWRKRALRAKSFLRKDLVSIKQWIRQFNDAQGGIDLLLGRADVLLHEMGASDPLMVDIHSHLGRCALNRNRPSPTANLTQ